MKSILIAVICLTGLNSMGQFYLAPEFGTNLLSVRTDTLGHDYHLGWHGGIAARYDFNNYFSLRSGVYFTQKKQSFSSSDTSQINIFGFDLTDLGIPGADFSIYTNTSGITSQFYMQVPILACYSNDKFSVSYGPFVGFNIYAWTKQETITEVPFAQAFEVDSLDPSGTIGAFFPPGYSYTFKESSSRNGLRFFDYGFKTGVTYQADHLAFNLNYVFSIPDYREDRGDLQLQRHHYFQVSIAYWLGFGKENSNSRY